MKVAVLGATGAVGRTMLQLLEERLPEADVLVPLASERSRGTRLPWRGGEWAVEVPRPGAFAGCDVALFSAGAAVSREWAPVAASEGAVVVDNSSAWRMDADVPLVVPEVNGEQARSRPKGIIANPNCSTIQLVIPLHALHLAAGLVRVAATTYQSVSGAGQKGVRAYRTELGGARADASPFPGTIAGNVIPRVGPMAADGWTEEEEKMRNETRKILGLPSLEVTATCARVPVEVGHAVSAVVELAHALTVAEAREALEREPGVRVAEEGRDPTPRDVAGTDDVWVGRLRRDPDRAHLVHMWIVADNLRKGAATNAVQIAALLRE